MRAIVLDGAVRFDPDYPEPRPREGEALIRPTLAGICDTDLQLARGYMGYRGVLGHEFVGVVESASGEGLAGKRVVGEINAACRSCRLCERGLEEHCPNRTVLGILGRDGAFADFLVLPEENLHIVPENVPDTQAVFTEPLAAAFEILRQAPPAPSDRVAVVGDGKLGMLIAQVLKTTGCDLSVIGRHAGRLDLLRNVGITSASLERDVADLSSEYDIVVDATGSARGLARAMEFVRPRGTVVLKTTVAQREGFDMNKLVIDEITLVGSRCGPFEPALDALAGGMVKVEPLVTDITPLSDGVRAMAMAEDAGALKILLSME